MINTYKGHGLVEDYLSQYNVNIILITLDQQKRQNDNNNKGKTKK